MDLKFCLADLLLDLANMMLVTNTGGHTQRCFLCGEMWPSEKSYTPDDDCANGNLQLGKEHESDGCGIEDECFVFHLSYMTVPNRKTTLL